MNLPNNRSFSSSLSGGSTKEPPIDLLSDIGSTLPTLVLGPSCVGREAADNSILLKPTPPHRPGWMHNSAFNVGTDGRSGGGAFVRTQELNVTFFPNPGDHKKRAKYRFASKTLMRILPTTLKDEVEGLIAKNTMTLDLYELLGQCTWGQRSL